MSVAMALSIESLLSNPAAPIRFLAGSGILISVLGLCVYVHCVLSFVVSGDGLDIVLTTHSGRLALVNRSSVRSTL